MISEKELDNYREQFLRIHQFNIVKSERELLINFYQSIIQQMSEYIEDNTTKSIIEHNVVFNPFLT